MSTIATGRSVPIPESVDDATGEHPPRSGHAPELGHALRGILSQLKSSPSLDPRPSTVAAGEVIADVAVAGVRYVLVRTRPPAITITPRETEVMRLVAQGMANKTIAAVLGISPWTVSTHLRRLFEKLDVGSRAELIARSVGTGIDPTDGEAPFRSRHSDRTELDSGYQPT